MTTLLVTRKDDVHVDMVIDHLRNENLPYYRLNTECSLDYLFSFNLDDGYIINTITNLKLKLSAVTSVYLRRRSLPDNPEINESDRIFADREWTKFTRNLWVLLGQKKWINKPNSLEVAKDKLLQLQLAKKIGFNIPKTLMTNSHSEVKNFASNMKIIYKAFDGGSLFPGSDRSIYTTILHDEVLSKIPVDTFKVCPGFFQEYIDKVNELRVTIVGNKVFATEIDSQSSKKTQVDWRRFDGQLIPHKITNLNEKEIDMCLKVTRSLDLTFGAIDLIRGLDGSLTFLEVNPNGQWAWIEVLTNEPISKAIATELAHK